MTIIRSRHHPFVRDLEVLRDDQDSPFMFLEGGRLVADLLESNIPVEILAWTSQASEEPVLARAQAKAKRAVQLSQNVFGSVSGMRTPQGLLAIARRPQWTWADLLAKSPRPLVILDGLQDPGNVAALLRTAEAAGAAGLLTTPGTARLFSPKALRGAMGSTLRLCCLEHVPLREIAFELEKASYQIVGTEAGSPSGSSIPYTQFDWTGTVAIVMGQEGRGRSCGWTSIIKAAVHIPMMRPVDSLNVGAAAAVLLYESLRQRSGLGNAHLRT